RGVADIFVTDRRLISSHLIEIKTLVPEIRGRERTYTLKNLATPGGEPSSIAKRFGSESNKFTLGRREGKTKWLIPSLVGIIGVGLLLAIFAFVVPLLRSKRFEQKYVVPYVPRPGRQILDPMTREPITPGEPVVNICAMVVPLQTWNDCGGQCPHYSGCTNNNLQCKGEGRGESTKFFSLNGVNRRLNWVWFGACGGVLGWLIYALVGGLGEEAIAKVADTLAHLNDDADTLVRDSLLGACFGLGLTFMLAWMEERAQSRKKSWPRIIGRALLGGLWATAAFGGGYLLLEGSIITAPILAAAISWVLFGVGLGFILSLKSSIDHQRGLLGGLLAGVVGFLIYWISSGLFDTSLIPKVLSLLVAGGLLGLVLDTVVKLAESYEKEYVSPENYRRNVPLSKWLKSDWEIQIGSQPGSQVYVKWPDESVLPEHAVMKMEDGRVFLLPQGETLVNGKIINGSKRTQLASGDTIQLGRRGITTMRFWER
ncbi:MAG: FHA domain-containing protein, partial [Bacteroidota bacterium]